MKDTACHDLATESANLLEKSAEQNWQTCFLTKVYNFQEKDYLK